MKCFFIIIRQLKSFLVSHFFTLFQTMNQNEDNKANIYKYQLSEDATCYWRIANNISLIWIEWIYKRRKKRSIYVWSTLKSRQSTLIWKSKVIFFLYSIFFEMKLRDLISFVACCFRFFSSLAFEQFGTYAFVCCSIIMRSLIV